MNDLTKRLIFKNPSTRQQDQMIRMFELEIGELSCSSRVLMVMYDKEKDEKDEKGRLGSYWRLELIKAMPSTDGWEGQMELVELDGA